MYCQYYQVTTNKPKTWFVVGCFRSEENLVFERTLDKQKSILEFFVTPECEKRFLSVINYLKKHGYVLECEKRENRLITENVDG